MKKQKKKVLVLATLLCIIGIAVAAGLTKGDEKEQLVNTIFAGQLQQPQRFEEHLAAQLEATFAAQSIPEEKQKQALAILAKQTQRMAKAIEEILYSTYTLEELRAKKAFESSDLNEKLQQQEGQLIELMKLIYQVMQRQAILHSAQEKFSDDADGIIAIVNQLANDTTMPDAERIKAIAKAMDTEEKGAAAILVMMGLSQSRVQWQQQISSKENIDQQHLAAANQYAGLAQLDKAVESAARSLSGDVDSKALEEAKQQLAIGLTKQMSQEFLTEANTYYSSPMAQSIVAKDLLLVEKISAAASKIVSSLNEEIHPLLEQ